MTEEMRQSRFFILAGPSGVGKETILHKVQSEFPFYTPVAYTTRKPIRKGEIDGTDYNFISEETFQRMVDNDEFLEHVSTHRWHFGIALRPVMNALKRGQNILAAIDVKGAAIVKEKLLTTMVVIYIQYDPGCDLDEQITARLEGDKTRVELSDAEVQTRIATAHKEEEQKYKFDYLVTNYNDRLDQAVEEVKQIIRAELAK